MITNLIRWLIMGWQCDLGVVLGEYKQRSNYTCLLTGQPCGLVKVVLRKMTLLVPFWCGEKVVIQLPLEKVPNLSTWQYVRMLRPWAALLAFMGALLVTIALDLKPGSPPAVMLAVGTCASGLIPWFGLGVLLNRYEFVRLVGYHYDKAQRVIVTLRFASELLARLAIDALVLEED